MLQHDHEQGTPEWYAARLGKPTASNFSKIITSTGKASTSLDGYVNTLVAESLMGEPPEHFESEWMRRGTELEPEARAWFEFQTDLDVRQVGFVTLDNGSAGCSPDGITDLGGLEIKCPKAETHVGYLRAGKLPAAYVQQVQGSMWICEADRWDFVSYHPLMPKLHVTVRRDDKFIGALAELISQVIERRDFALDQIRRMAA